MLRKYACIQYITNIQGISTTQWLSNNKAGHSMLVNNDKTVQEGQTIFFNKKSQR